jgi:magnesium transporter
MRRRAGGWRRPLPAIRGRSLVRLLVRLLWVPVDEDRSAPVERTNPDSVVDCALYVDGRREPGRPHYADAADRAGRRRNAFVWLGLHDPDAEGMAEVGRAFGLHELTVAQALRDGHRPGIDQEGGVTRLALRTARYVEHAELTGTSEVVDTGDVVVLIGDRFAITVRHGAAGALTAVRADLERRPALLATGPWAVGYAVCARMVDRYLEVADRVEHDVERIEETVLARDHGQDVQHVYQLKRELVEFKRAVVPLRVPLLALTGDRQGELPPQLRRYFVDVQHRLLRAVDRVASFDELLNSILQARLAQVTVDQNNDLRKIGSWGAIAAVQTTIAGVYGMNFDNMPGIHWRYGYYAVLAVMAVVAVTLYRMFRRSGWL